MRHQHLDRFKDKQLPPLAEIVELSLNKTLSLNMLKTKPKQNTMAKNISRVHAPALKLGGTANKRKATELGTAPGHRLPKKSKRNAEVYTTIAAEEPIGVLDNEGQDSMPSSDETIHCIRTTKASDDDEGGPVWNGMSRDKDNGHFSSAA